MTQRDTESIAGVLRAKRPRFHPFMAIAKGPGRGEAVSHLARVTRTVRSAPLGVPSQRAHN